MQTGNYPILTIDGTSPALRSANNLQPPENKESSALDGNYPHRVMEFRQVVFGKNVVKNGNFSDVDEKKKTTKE